MNTRPGLRTGATAHATGGANTSPTIDAAVDGRHAWRDRNLNAVVDALLDLFSEGNLRPGADEIAARSGVSRRSVFRYFDDLDTLDRAAIARQQARVAHLVDLPDAGHGSFAERVERLTQQRVRLFDAITPVARVARLREPFEPVVAEDLRRNRRFLKRQIERQFAAELQALARGRRSATLAAADVLCSFESYHLLTGAHGLTPKQAGDAMSRGLTALLAPAATARNR
jgi:AcrR family transcriptional regulator